MTPALKLRSALTSVVFVVVIALTGCAPQQADYGAEIAEVLQGEVLEVSQLAADADFGSALLALTELEVSLKDARARGLLTEERYESITAAVAQVRTDLDAAIAALAPPPPAPEPEGGGDGDDGEDDEGEGNSGKGNNGKGNDNGNDDD